MKKILVMFLSIVLCFGLAACGSEGDGGDKKDKNEYGVNETADYDGVEVTVKGFEESTGNSWGSPEDGKVFVYANIEIKNNTEEPIDVSSMLSFDCYCDDYTIDYSSDALFAASTEDRQQLDGEVAAGKLLDGWLGVEVPTDWSNIEIVYNKDLTSDTEYKHIIENK